MKNVDLSDDHAKIKEPFVMPEGYLVRMQQEVMQQVEAMPHRQTATDRLPTERRTITLPTLDTPAVPTSTLWQRIAPMIYLAAVMVGLGLFIRLFVGEAPQESFATNEPLPYESVEPLSEDEFYEVYSSQSTGGMYVDALYIP